MTPTQRIEFVNDFFNVPYLSIKRGWKNSTSAIRKYIGEYPFQNTDAQEETALSNMARTIADCATETKYMMRETLLSEASRKNINTSQELTADFMDANSELIRRVAYNDTFNAKQLLQGEEPYPLAQAIQSLTKAPAEDMKKKIMKTVTEYYVNSIAVNFMQKLFATHGLNNEYDVGYAANEWVISKVPGMEAIDGYRPECAILGDYPEEERGYIFAAYKFLAQAKGISLEELDRIE